ncbi:hypothetical protein FOCC_FOCC012943 [Frankliniella occidentalis]|nr:hypothetical protein FOCC_FOCC012943 [Frankliniella occidentalis]
MVPNSAFERCTRFAQQCVRGGGMSGSVVGLASKERKSRTEIQNIKEKGGKRGKTKDEKVKDTAASA